MRARNALYWKLWFLVTRRSDEVASILWSKSGGMKEHTQSSTGDGWRFQLLVIELGYLKVTHSANIHWVEDVLLVWTLSRHVRPLKIAVTTHGHTMGMTRPSCSTHLVLKGSPAWHSKIVHFFSGTFQWQSSHWWCAIGPHSGLVYKYSVIGTLNIVLFWSTSFGLHADKSLSAMSWN